MSGGAAGLTASAREVLRVALESEGYSVTEAADGREGVGLYREHRPALTIVDIVMPEKDGIEMVKEILAIDSAAVIFTMSWKDEVGDYQETARMLAARRGFEKPEGFSRHHHLGTVQIALRNLLPYSSGGVVN